MQSFLVFLKATDVQAAVQGSPHLKLVNAAKCHSPSVLLQLGLTVISNLAATAEGAALLLKSPLLSNTEQQLHHLLQRREGPRTSALLGPLINLAVHGEGQKQILRAACAPGQQSHHHLACISHNKLLLRLLMPSFSLSLSC